MALESWKTKHPASNNGRKKAGRNSVYVLIFTALLFLLFRYTEDVKNTFGGGDMSPEMGHEEFPIAEPRQEPVEEVVLVKDSTMDGDEKNIEASPEIKEENREEEARQEQPEMEAEKPAEQQQDPVRVVEPVVQEEARSQQQQEQPAKSEGEQEEQQQPEKQQPEKEQPEQEAIKPEEAKVQQRVVLDLPTSCDWFTGRWVYDDKRYPIYKEPECQFLTEQVTCMRNGRRDDTFQKWRWQPKDCSLPQFDVKLMLERLRGKRVMFVGDSLNRNQWESMICLVQSLSPWEKKNLTKGVGNRNIFRLEDYNTTIEFYWAPFLVESNSDDPKIHSIQDRIIKPGSIEKHGKHWKDVDYLIFNTYIWWMNTPEIKVLRGSFTEGSTEYDKVDRPIAYRRVLKTWAKWVQRNIDTKRTMVFFMSMSPNHIHSEAWGKPNGIKCALERHPVTNLSHPLDVGTDWRLFAVAENVIRSMKKVPVTYVKITEMSEMRKDAHTSVHTLRQGKLLTKDQQANPAKFADCIHWCLPGLPDVWNEFIYLKIASTPWNNGQ